jgi:opacity protein-like surface antigen
MKKIIFIVITVISGISAFSQKTASSGFILSANGGIAIPVGGFSKADYADEKSGFAKAGGHYNITGTYYLNKNFGIGLLFGYSQFGHKGSQSLADGYKEDSGTDSTTLYTKGSNHTFSILAGPYYRIPISDKWSVDFRALGGYVNTHLAGFQVFYEDYTDNAMSQKESSGGGFGFQLGAGVQYHITHNIAVQFNADYFSSKPKIDITYENFIVNSGRKLDSYNQSISGFDTSLGLAFTLLGK